MVESLFLVIGLLFAWVVIYLYFLAAVSLWPEKKAERDVLAKTKFGIVIPARDEAAIIGATLDGLRRVDYPAELYDVFVIADNCRDDTAGVARKRGVTCWERNDSEPGGGKGHVLKWAFARLVTKGEHDAYVVVDADTSLATDFLRKLNNRLVRGAKAVQAYTDVLTPEGSPQESLAFLGFVLNRNLRYRARPRLGWTSNLMGTGMCFAREVIEEHGWQALSVVEDVEYEMFLLMRDIRVVFAPEVKLWFRLHNTFRDSGGQRRRWDLGKFAVRDKYLPGLLRQGFRRRDPAYFDAAMELLIPPYSLFILLTLVCFFLYLLFGFNDVNLTFYLWTSIVGAMVAYTLCGLVYAGAGVKVYLSLLYVPFFVLWRFWLVVQGALRKKGDQW